MSQVLELTDTSFQEEISKGVTLVDFWAEWCGPCRIQGPIIDQLAQKIGDKAKCTKLDVDANPGVAGKFGISSIPTIMIFKDGEPVNQMIGLQTLDVLESAIDQA